MILRSRPTVMISSTIGELAEVRTAVATALEAQDLTDGWLFELHATASGQDPESQYLEIARACDIYVVIVAEQGSPATEAEYEAACDDNPAKVLAFYVGGPNERTASFRDRIDARHTRIECDVVDEVPPKIVEAVANYVLMGEVIRSGLVADLDRRLRRSEEVVAADLAACFVPHLRHESVNDQLSEVLSSTEPIPATALFDGLERRIALEGIGGSGKSHAALAMVRHLARGEILPLILTPHADQTSIGDLISAEFDSVRFYPGHDLTEEMARRGKLAVVVDGVDALAADARRTVLADLASYARRFPRSRFVCCARRLLPGELADFGRFGVEPLSEVQIADLFEVAGVDRLERFPEQVADLASWPLWALALLEVGTTAETGLVLLARLLEQRIEASGAYLPLEAEMLLEAAAHLAFRSWPETSVSPTTALDLIDRWSSSARIVGRYSMPPAAEVIERLSAAGVVQQARALTFAHPLFATFLAAHEAALVGCTEQMRDDPEFAMFVAAMLSEDQTDEQIDLLDRHGPVGQARFLRLVPEQDRRFEPADPAAFGAFVERLTGIAAECIATDGWTAWREAEHPARCDPDLISQWLANGVVALLQGNAFERRTPVSLAAIESVGRFKSRARDLEPRDADWLAELSKHELAEIRRGPSADLDEMLLESAIEWRRGWHELIRALNVDTLAELQPPDGEPQVNLIEEWPSPWVQLLWGDEAGVRRLESDAGHQWNFEPLARFLGPGREARLYKELARRTEEVLGCTFGSEAWTRPERVAAWAW